MKIALIAAIAENKVIGKDNQLPWHLPADLQHFKQLTLGKPILMGRKTFESIGKPLPGRHSIILTRDNHFDAAGCAVRHTFDDAFQEAQAYCEHQRERNPMLMVIGGAQLYAHCLPLATDLYLTQLHQAFEGDTAFPDWDHDQWQLTSATLASGPEFDYEFQHWQRGG